MMRITKRLKRDKENTKRDRVDSRTMEAIKQRRSKFTRMLNAVTRGGVDRALGEQIGSLRNAEAEFRESLDTREKALLGYRRVSGGSTYDLNPIDHDNMIDVVVQLWQNNGMAKRFIEDPKNAIIGDGITTKKTDHKRTDEITESFWWDKDNHWSLKGNERVRELFLMGEMIVTAYVSDQTGAVRLGFIDPSDVKEVIYNKNNKEEAWSVILKGTPTTPEKEYRVIRRDRSGSEGLGMLEAWKKAKEKEAPGSFKESELGSRFKTEGRLIGDQTKVGTEEPVGVFYFPVNKLRGQLRGVSDLWVSADWVDVYDKILFDLTDRESLIKAFVYDITLKGANPEQCREKVRELALNPPVSASYQVHSEDETWEVKTPNINAKDTSESARLVRGMATMGAILPEFWYSPESGKSDQSGKSREQLSKPTMMMLTEKQNYIKHIIETMQDFSYDQAWLASYLTYESEEEEIEVRKKTGVIMSEISKEDMNRVTDSLAKLTPTLESAVSTKWIENGDAAKVYVMLLNQLGADVSALEEGEGVENDMQQTELLTNLLKAWQNTMTSKMPTSPVPSPEPLAQPLPKPLP